MNGDLSPELLAAFAEPAFDPVAVEVGDLVTLRMDGNYRVLEVALRQPFAYVGAMGSRRTHDDRMKRLREAGVPEDALSRLASPIGLDLGARTPEETAVSIAAEIIASQWGGGGARLTETDGRIHHDPEPHPGPRE